jgi:3-phosphoshikimate 1-carboxyvinyltransferase
MAMDVALLKSQVIGSPHVKISGSKSETNRMLLLQQLYPEITLENISVSDDSIAMTNALQSSDNIIDIGHAGTAMRFLTAYFAICENRTVTLTGSERMQQRPIGILIDGLRQLGADIEYLDKDGFPPLKISGKKITKNQVRLRADVSSQFISALLLIAPKLQNGLELKLEGVITSRPYIDMTLALLNQIGVATSLEGQIIKISPFAGRPSTSHRPLIMIESDWSSASYFYSIVALSKIGTVIKLSTFKKESFQGDSALIDIYKNFGVDSTFEQGSLIIRKSDNCQLSIINYQLNDNPDLAQTIAVTSLGHGIDCKLTGLHTLKIKETNRLSALKTELEKLGANVSITEDSISFTSAQINSDVTIETYEDHRMAMAFAPLAVKVPIVIEDAEVVSKSYPSFWNDLKSIGFDIEST